jgi:cell division inhibitor SepF
MSVFRKAAEFLGLVDDETAEYPLDDGYLEESEYGADAQYLDHDDPGVAPRSRGDNDAPRTERLGRVGPSDAPSGGVTVMRAGARLEPVAVVAQSTSISARATTNPSPSVRAIPATAPHVHVFEPRSFNDAQEIGDRVKSGQPVIVNLQSSDRELQRRLIDFASGVCYALNGTMSKVADHVFLLTPANVDVSDDEVERLSARGLYRAR